MRGIKIIGALCALAMLVAGCNSTEQTLQPIPGQQVSLQSTEISSSTSAPMFPGPPDPAAPPQIPGASAQQASLPAVQLRGQIRFMPVIGAPVNAVTPLSRQLAVEARNRGLAILSASDPGGDHVLKGYFSADNYDGQTTVFYVWDVLDTAGNRLHRIQGQEAFAGGAGDPWTLVPADVMERIAARSLADYAAWRRL